MQKQAVWHNIQLLKRGRGGPSLNCGFAGFEALAGSPVSYGEELAWSVLSQECKIA